MRISFVHREPGLCRLPDPRVIHQSYLFQTCRCIDPFRHLPTSVGIEYSHRTCSCSLKLLLQFLVFLKRFRKNKKAHGYFDCSAFPFNMPIPYLQTALWFTITLEAVELLPPRHCFYSGPGAKTLALGLLNSKDAASMVGCWYQHLLLLLQESSLGYATLCLITPLRSVH